MASKKQSKRYLKGCEDIQRSLEVINDAEKQVRRAAYIKEHFGKHKAKDITNMAKPANEGEYK